MNRKILAAALAATTLVLTACGGTVEARAAALADDYRDCVHGKPYEWCVDAYSSSAARKFSDENAWMDDETVQIVSDAFTAMARDEGVIE